MRPLGLLLLLILSACAALPTPAPIVLDENGQPRYTSFDTATLSADGTTLELRFTGGGEYAPDDPCSVAYAPRAEVIEGELVVGIVELVHPLAKAAAEKPAPPGVAVLACDAMGHARVLVVELAEPFDGQEVRDLSGATIKLDRSGG